MTTRKQLDAAARAWQLISDYALAEFRHKSRNLTDIGLTLGHMKALIALETGEARPMGVCAQALGCDASTATWLIDRLEEKGLVERQPSPNDRRVKGVVLTSAGSHIKTSLQEHFSRPPAALQQLSYEELEELSALLTKLITSAEDDPDSASPAHMIQAAGGLGR